MSQCHNDLKALDKNGVLRLVPKRQFNSSVIGSVIIHETMSQ